MEVFLAFDPREAVRASAFAASLFSGSAEGPAQVPAEAPVDASLDAPAGASAGPGGFTYWLAAPDAGVFIDPHVLRSRFYDPQGRELVIDENKVASAVGVLAVLTGTGAAATVLVAAIEVAHARGRPVVGVRLDEEALAPRNLAERCIYDATTRGALASARVRVEAAIRGWVDQREVDRQRPWFSRVWRALRADRDLRR